MTDGLKLFGQLGNVAPAHFDAWPETFRVLFDANSREMKRLSLAFT
jgi:hypothetical protein